MQFFFKHQNNSLPIYFQSLKFSQASEIHQYDTRNRNCLYPNRVNRKFTGNCTRNYVIKLVNETDVCILNKISTHSYKGFSDYAIYVAVQIRLLYLWSYFLRSVIFINMTLEWCNHGDTFTYHLFFFILPVYYTVYHCVISSMLFFVQTDINFVT